MRALSRRGPQVRILPYALIKTVKIRNILAGLKGFLSYILLFIVLYVFIDFFLGAMAVFSIASLSSFGEFQRVFAPVIAGIVTI